jgi:hypothetical protein
MVDGLFDVADDSLARFLRAWYGEPDRTAATLTNPQLPAALRTWYSLAASYSTPVTSHNVFLEPDRIAASDGMAVFWLENQDVYEWAFEADGAEPLVFERATVDGEPWHPTGVRLTPFLVSVAVFEAIMGAEQVLYRDSLSGSTRAALLAPLRPLPMPGPTVGAQLYAGDGLLAFTGPADASMADGWLYLASLTTDGLAYSVDLA